MKVIANRFKIVFPKIISQEQARFIAGRSIIDNVIIAQEVLHTMGSKGMVEWMAVKIDLEKAYNNVHWDFVEASLRVAAIPNFLIQVIMSAISMSTMQVLWNRVPAEKFKHVRGISQVNKDLVGKITNMLDFQHVHDLDHYLGVPLIHQRITKSTLNFVIERVRKKLSSWKAKKLSFVGRVTLVQSVFLSIPSYLMQSLIVPKGGSSGGRRKMALVIWDVICQPRLWGGGVGLRHLSDQNSTFMMKLGSNIVTKT
ncbi:reverse transcriptase [Gossypium australe]|uniref:Reverse transcriptase n=1 Tax=Gossypium australe TaxID=47621 RepID=A0A5B6VAE0_9ROSI|nr:reverse transcriptase [Gossypium australe]